ncbi:MAG: type II secretion system F family protein [Myxococcota bacterium]
MNAIVLGLAVFVMLICMVGVYGVYLLLNPTRTAADRLRDLQGDGEDRVAVADIIVQQEDDEALLTRLGGGSLEERSIMRRKLVQAGYKHKHALEILTFTRIAMAIGLPIILIPVTSTLSLMYAIGLSGFAVLFGYMGPYLAIENAVNKRKEELLSTFPDCLDLLVSSVEAGLGLDAAFRRVSAEMEQAAPALAKEFQLVNNEISAGVPRVEALRHLEKRTGLDEIRSLVNMLAQAERFGTSIAKSLRVHASVTRQKRMSKAEEEAAKVSPKLTVIMILFLLPVLGLMLMGPALIKVYRMLQARG